MAYKKRTNRPQKNAGMWVDFSQLRVYFSLFVLLGLFGLLATRLVWVGLAPTAEPSTRLADLPAAAPVRGDIYDKNGILLATTVKAYSLYADPKVMLDKEEAAQKLANTLRNVSASTLRKKFSRKGRFVWIKRHLTPREAQLANNLGLPGVGLREELVRLYPHQNLASHVLGAVNLDGYGIAGVEAAYDKPLRQGKDLTLTLDLKLQQQLRTSLEESIAQASAKGAAGVVLHPKTGAILAMSSLPDFDPNDYGNSPSFHRMNRASAGVYEMGSTFKILTAAQALDKGIVERNTVIDCTNPVRIGRYKISDFHAKARPMTVEEVVAYSSNIGSSKIAEMMGADKMRDFLRDLGMFERIESGVQENARPLTPRRWGPTELATVSYGHGISVTPMHIAAAFNTLVTDGQYRRPHLVAQSGNFMSSPVVSTTTVSHVRDLMRHVVQNGTASRARVAGYDIGGKTGTAEKLVGGKYQDGKNIASFVGAVPLNNPQLVAVMLIDEGKKGLSGGGQIAAPTFANFVQRAMPVLGLTPTNTPKQPLVAYQPKLKQVAHASVQSSAPSAN